MSLMETKVNYCVHRNLQLHSIMNQNPGNLLHFFKIHFNTVYLRIVIWLLQLFKLKFDMCTSPMCGINVDAKYSIVNFMKLVLNCWTHQVISGHTGDPVEYVTIHKVVCSRSQHLRLYTELN
jgi:hypothetical protein